MQTMQFNPIRTLRLLLVSVCTFLITGPAMAIEEPEYEVMQRAAPFEVRHYRPFIVAETIVDGRSEQCWLSADRWIYFWR